MNAANMSFGDRVMAYVQIGVVSGLSRVGLETAQVMKRALREADPYPAVYKRFLIDSITYALMPAPPVAGFPGSMTAPGNPSHGPVGARARESDIIKPVKKRNTLKVGTADPKGHYINEGTLPHKTKKDSAEFVANIVEWCAKKGFDEEFTIELIKKIRRFGTAEKPFLEPGKVYAESVLSAYVQKGVRKALKSMPKIQKTVDKDSVHFKSRMR